MKAAITTVSKINSYIKNMFTQDFLLNSVYVKGEVSNCKYHTSGHIYFTLKDAGGTLSCVMFASKRSGLNFKMTEGQQVIVGGSIEVYERDGKYQLYANRITLDGQGLLYERFEQLKQELKESGMFEPEYKMPLPAFPKKIGIVTAPTGAAVRDIINVATRRNPYVQLILYPAIVQGDEAVPSIIRGIKALIRENVDVMIVGRGGGSIEDLWAFNERAVAEAVFESPIPIISAVGHETDTTIIDFVSDMRAPTPSAAAELAVPEISVIFDILETKKNKMDSHMSHKIYMARNLVDNKRARIDALSPAGKLALNKNRLEGFENRLKNLMDSKLKDAKMDVIRMEDDMRSDMDNILRNARHRMELQAGRLNGLSPLDKLSQGYSYTSNSKGQTVNSIKKVEADETIHIFVKDGKINAQVITVDG